MNHIRLSYTHTQRFVGSSSTVGRVTQHAIWQLLSFLSCSRAAFNGRSNVAPLAKCGHLPFTLQGILPFKPYGRSQKAHSQFSRSSLFVTKLSSESFEKRDRPEDSHDAEGIDVFDMAQRTNLSVAESLVQNAKSYQWTCHLLQIWTKGGKDEKELLLHIYERQFQVLRPESEAMPTTSAASSPIGRFFAEQGSSRTGKHPTLLYRLPGTAMSYTFTYKRDAADHHLYQCQQCKQKGKWTGIKVLNGEFLSDPCSLDHHSSCVPVRTARVLVERAVYEFNRNIKSDASFAGRKPKPVWLEQMKIVKEKAEREPTLRDEMLAQHYKSGVISRRDAIKRALATHEEQSASMLEIPPHLRLLPDGTSFVHHMEPSLHVYYSSATLQNGLKALVADGVHSYQPRQLKRAGQLYTLHGVCNNGIKVPLVYAVTASKNEEVYTTIFGYIYSEFEASVMPTSLRIILDFERAAISAAGRVFPRATVQGCAFHLAQAWNRRRDRLGITPFLEGPLKAVEVAEWWDTIKGLVFLPRRLHRLVRALEAPPVPRQHPASIPCQLFLTYLRETWYDGIFSDLWDKYGVEELRTTNLAEAYHSQLNTLITCEHPQLGKLIEVLRSINEEANSALTTLEQFPSQTKHLRNRDRERRERITSQMRRFTEEYNSGISRARIETYCRTMARFVSNRMI